MMKVKPQISFSETYIIAYFFTISKTQLHIKIHLNTETLLQSFTTIITQPVCTEKAHHFPLCNL